MFLKALDRLEEIIITVLIAAATLVIFVAVVHRYGMSSAISLASWGRANGHDWLFDAGRATFMFMKGFSFTWAQELCIYLFVWMAKFGAAYGARTGIHVGVDVAINRLQPSSRQVVVLFALCAGAFFTFLVGSLGARFVWHMAHTDQISADLEMPMWIVYLAVPLGSYLMCFRFLQVAWAFLRTGELPHHDHGHVDGLEDAAPTLPGALIEGGHASDPPVVSQSGRVSPDALSQRSGWMLVMIPLGLALACFAAKFGLLPIGPGLRVGMIFALLVALMLTGMPISIALGLTVMTFLFTLTDVPMDSVALKLFTGIEKFEIMAIPFFILAGNFLTHGGVARRMINFASSMVGHWHGGLGLAGVVACALFAAVSGSSPATVVAIGSILLPAMVKQGFPPRFGAGVITTSGALGILIPPSIVMVMYAVATSGMMVEGPTGEKVSSASVGQLFMAGVIPGLMLATFLGLTTFYRAWKNGYPRLPKAGWGERFSTFRESIWGLLLIIIVIGGIYTGAFTPTEAAAMSAAYAFFIAVFVYKDMRLVDVPRVLLSSANMSAMLLYIITNAVLFSFLMTSEQIPQAMAQWISGTGLNWITFLLLVNLLLLLAGNVMEPSSIVLIMAPILFPMAVKLGIDPVHFGILIVVNMEVGMCHPPVGLNLYVASGITKMGITELTIAVWPWLLTMLGFLVLVTYWPDLSLWLPRMLGML